MHIYMGIVHVHVYGDNTCTFIWVQYMYIYMGIIHVHLYGYNTCICIRDNTCTCIGNNITYTCILTIYGKI